jgi:hypothetical protein
MEEGSFDIHMLDVPIKYSGDVKQGPEGFKARGGSSSLFVVDHVPLGKAFGDIADLVASDVPSVIAFAFADKFTA